MTEQPLNFYVYTLLDPIDNSIFYVGKGQGLRALQHEVDADSSFDSSNDKHLKISQIKSRDENNEVVVRVIGRYETEQEALAVESTLIKWVYGFENLTNKVHGHHHLTIRDHGNLSIIEGIDIARVPRQSGDFTENVKQANIQYGIESKLLSLHQSVLTAFPDVEPAGSYFERKKDPAIYLRVNDFTRLQLMIRPSGTNKVVTNIRSMTTSRTHTEKFKTEYENRFDVKGGNDPYFKLSDWGRTNPHISNLETILDRVKVVLDTLGG